MMVWSTQTDNGQTTVFMEDGKQVYPCRCGQMHKGDYACEDMMKHECIHDCALVRLTPDVVMCPLCAASWYVKGLSIADGGWVAVDYGLDEDGEGLTKH